LEELRFRILKGMGSGRGISPLPRKFVEFEGDLGKFSISSQKL